MPARHHHHDSTEQRKLFTITLETCSRSGGTRVHDAVETVITISRNMQRSSTRSLVFLTARNLKGLPLSASSWLAKPARLAEDLRILPWGGLAKA
jgi:hypothetical protein